MLEFGCFIFSMYAMAGSAGEDGLNRRAWQIFCLDSIETMTFMPFVDVSATFVDKAYGVRK